MLKEHIRIAKLKDGKTKKYDLASRTKKLNKSYSDSYDYIGYGTVCSIDGVIQNEEMQTKFYFFVMNPKHSLYKK